MSSRYTRFARRLALEQLEDRRTPAAFTVTSLEDSGPGSLREKINQANATAAHDTIEFSTELKDATINLILADDTTVGPTALRVSQPLTIYGSGQTLSRHPQLAQLRLLLVNAPLTMTDLTLANGKATDVGGAVYAAAPFTADRVLFLNNAVVGAAGGAARGGAVFLDGSSASFTNGTFSGNSAVGGAGVGSGASGGATGGAIFNRSGSLTLTHGTLSGNTIAPGATTGGAAGLCEGAAVSSLGDGTAAALVLRGNIIYGNTGPTNPEAADVRVSTIGGIASTVNAAARNILGGYSDASVGGSNWTGVTYGDPLLEPLKDNGGLTRTFALKLNSPALNGGNAGVLTRDARGVGRDVVPDLGAYEVQNPLSPVGVPVEPYVLYGPHPNASQNAAFVRGLFQATVLRPPSQAEVDYYTARLADGSVTRANIGNSFINSPENRGNQVTFYYNYFLGRDPDQAGLNFYIARLQGGESEASVLLSFILSTEFAGQNTNTQYTIKMYYAVLGRGAAQGEIDFYVNQLAAGTLTRADIINSFLASPEGIARIIRSNFQAYLGRYSTLAEEQQYTAQILGGLTFGQVAISMFGLDEFYANAGAQVP